MSIFVSPCLKTLAVFFNVGSNTAGDKTKLYLSITNQSFPATPQSCSMSPYWEELMAPAAGVDTIWMNSNKHGWFSSADSVCSCSTEVCING